MTSLIELADSIALTAHGTLWRDPSTGLLGEQQRKYNLGPYIQHPRRVAEIVSEYIQWDCVIATALLHDVLEDTEYWIEDITDRLFWWFKSAHRDTFYANIMTCWLKELTDVPKSYGNRVKRKQFDRERLARADREVQTIKCADLIDNTESIVKYDPTFAVLYLQEKEELLRVLSKAHPHILDRAWQVLRTGQQQLLDAALER